MIYFKSRAEAGQLLAERLAHHRNKPTVVMALDEGSALVGAEIANSLNSKLLLYKVRPIMLPNETAVTASVDMTGRIKYNDLLSVGQIEEVVGEYRNFIEQERFRHFHEMNILLGKGGVIKKEELRHHEVIVVADGMPSSFAVSMASDFLTTVAIKSLIAAVPVASQEAADQIHSVTDEQHILGIIQNYVDTAHYYDDNIIPTTDETLALMERVGEIKPIEKAIEKPVIQAGDIYVKSYDSYRI